MSDLQRFVDAQAQTYDTALQELRAGHKSGHWIWFILPQLASLGRSQTARHFGIRDLPEARAYLAHPVLGPRLVACFRALLSQTDLSATEILGPVDALKTRSCATLFRIASNGTLPEAGAILDRFYDGAECPQTRNALRS
jgi:uncharacterized protein (DUF1810 family)